MDVGFSAARLLPVLAGVPLVQAYVEVPGMGMRAVHQKLRRALDRELRLRGLPPLGATASEGQGFLRGTIERKPMTREECLTHCADTNSKDVEACPPNPNPFGVVMRESN